MGTPTTPKPGPYTTGLFQGIAGIEWGAEPPPEPGNWWLLWRDPQFQSDTLWLRSQSEVGPFICDIGFPPESRLCNWTSSPEDQSWAAVDLVNEATQQRQLPNGEYWVNRIRSPTGRIVNVADNRLGCYTESFDDGGGLHWHVAWAFPITSPTDSITLNWQAPADDVNWPRGVLSPPTSTYAVELLRTDEYSGNVVVAGPNLPDSKNRHFSFNPDVSCDDGETEGRSKPGNQPYQTIIEVFGEPGADPAGLDAALQWTITGVTSGTTFNATSDAPFVRCFHAPTAFDLYQTTRRSLGFEMLGEIPFGDLELSIRERQEFQGIRYVVTFNMWHNEGGDPGWIAGENVTVRPGA